MTQTDLTGTREQAAPGALQRLVTNAMFDKGLTLDAVARRSGLSLATIAALRSGGRGKRPRRDTLERLARGLDVPFDDVLDAAAPARDDPREQLVLSAFRQLGSAEQDRVLAALRRMAEDDDRPALAPLPRREPASCD